MTTENPPTVAACQMAVSDLDPAVNLETVQSRVAGLPPETDVAVFPEYALTGFVADERAHATALTSDSDYLADLRETAAATETALLVGFVEESDGAYYNAVAYLDPDGGGQDETARTSAQDEAARTSAQDEAARTSAQDEVAGTTDEGVGTTIYRKRHLWGNEETVLEPGRERVTVETPMGTAGLLTCYDLNFVGESAAFAGQDGPMVDALLVVGAWPAAHSQNWKLLLRARALDGVRWVVGAGRTGERTVGDPHQFAGRSRVVRPDGSVQAGLNRGERDLVADLDPAVLAECREFIPVHDDRNSS